MQKKKPMGEILTSLFLLSIFVSASILDKHGYVFQALIMAGATLIVLAGLVFYMSFTSKEDVLQRLLMSSFAILLLDVFSMLVMEKLRIALFAYVFIALFPFSFPWGIATIPLIARLAGKKISV